MAKLIAMKRLFYALSILWIINLTVSCEKKDNDKYSFLNDAEALMGQSPEKSLSILQIENPEKLPKAQYALWCLLITQARDKNYIEHTTDSLIRFAVDYYEVKKDERRLMAAYYYMASVWHDLGSSPIAQEYFLKSLEIAKEFNDHPFLGLIYLNLGSIYFFQDMLTEAFDFEKKALENFIIMKDSTNAGLSLQNLGRAFINNNQLDSALIYYHKAESFVTHKNRSGLYNDLGVLYNRKGEHEKAIVYIRQALSFPDPENDSIPVYSNLGNAYVEIGKYDSAMYYLSKCITPLSNIYTEEYAYRALAKLEEKQQNWQVCVRYLNKSQQLYDSIINTEKSEKLQRIQSLFNYQQAEKEKEMYKLEASDKQLLIYRLIIAIIIISGSLLFYLVRIKQRERVQREKVLLLKQQQHIQTQIYLEKQSESEGEILELKKSLEESTKRTILIKNLEDQFYVSAFYNKLNNEKTRMSIDDWAQLEAKIEELYPAFKTNLKVLAPNLAPDKIRLCYLKKIKIPVKNIANLFYKSSQAISKKSNRLYKEITGDNGDAGKLDEFIKNL